MFLGRLDLSNRPRHNCFEHRPSVIVEQMNLHGKSAVEILTELELRGIDASVRHPPKERKPRRSKWGPDGKKLPKSAFTSSGEL